MVRKKAKLLYAYFKEPGGSCGGECIEEFQALEGWFNKFKVKKSLEMLPRQTLLQQNDIPEEFAFLVADGGYKR
ncbi:unnamed protein product [Parnassius apollo]|uniref:(apollo) hypothetical protein n=1 Tax=Parnassius apollo TaxID=110799 RepID=A0A8S3W422_PARAO|nr:unnamed protein product [Parnassius apollo]